MDFYVIGLDLAKGVGLFFIHPLTYILIMFSLYLGFRRVKRERIDFHTRIYDVIDNLLSPLFPSLIAALFLSIFIVGLGIVIPLGVIALFSLVQLLILLTGQVRWLSPAYTGGLTLLIALVLPEVETGSILIDRWIVEIHAVHLGGLAILVGILLLIEGLLILKNGAKQPSPKLFKSKRGKIVGGYEIQRLWIVPTFLLLPNGAIAVLDIWPFIPTDYSNLSVMVLPFAIGFQQVIRSTLPSHAIMNYGKRILLVGILVIALSSLSIFYPILIPFVAVSALLAREIIAIGQKLREDSQINMYTQRENGLIILGVIPRSPASKMHVKIGEVITKVNGIQVRTEQQFYEALQQNSAFCKLEIIDENGEIRFGQTTLYDGEHHQIGLLFVHQENTGKRNIV